MDGKRFLAVLALLVLLTLATACGNDTRANGDNHRAAAETLVDNRKTTPSTEDSGGARKEADTMAQDDKKALEALYHEMWRALLDKDIKRLDEIHADGFVLVHMTGLHQPKAEYMRCVRDGELNYFTETTEHIGIEIHGDTAAFIGQSRVEAAVFGGGKNTWPLQLAFEAKKENGRWRLTGAKASTY